MLPVTKRIAGAVIALGALATVLTGCGPSEQPGAKADYVEFAEGFPSLRAERLREITSCLEREGFPGAVIREDGTTQIDVPPEQQEAYDIAASTCLLEVCDACGSPVSAATWERLYRLEVEAGKCLAAEGIEVSDPPTLQVYLDTIPEARWSPHREIAMEGQVISPDAVSACPDPGDFVTYW